MPTNAEIHANITLYISGQRSHILNNTVAQVFHDMVDNIAAGGGGGGITDITYANLLTAISGSTLTAGATYKITDRGDRGIYLQAISTNELSKIGIREMLCPSFYGTGANGGNTWRGVWNIGKTAAAGELIIWGGLVWENLTGNIGSNDSDILLDAVNWTVVPKASFSNGEYIEMLFGVSFDVQNDWIEQQWDGSGNVFGTDYATEQFNQLGFNPCDASDWNYATNAQLFYNNKADGVFNNSSIVHICRNIVYQTIKNNSCGMIVDNWVGAAIRSNTNGGWIIDNFIMGGIEQNANGGEISFNRCYNILANANNGKISNNIVPHNIQENENDGEITFNMNNGKIKDNLNIGYISYNVNNGDINACESGVDPCNIHHNINNGNISGTFAADVLDTIVDKS